MASEKQVPYHVLYPRDPSLDPQLVWKGKDQQDREDLAVPDASSHQDPRFIALGFVAFLDFALGVFGAGFCPCSHSRSVATL